MQLVELERMNAVERDHWWFAGKRALFRRLLRERLAPGGLRILDVGCGTGEVSLELSRYGRVWSLDRSPEALKFARGRGVARGVVGDASRLPFRSSSFDLVTAFDIIEHVEDDHAMARDLKRIIAPGGALAVHVPAWPFLFGRHDVALEHKRRYTRRSLRALLTGAGFRLEHLGWASCTILAPAIVVRTAEKLLPSSGNGGESDIYPLPGPLNSAMLTVYKVEAELAATVGLPFGLSLAAVAVAD